jgi:NTP pyrophosphatase (non-canonical NTP hydrolase)
MEDDMDFSNYQFRAGKTAKYPNNPALGIIYTALGLASEAGEVAGKVKKMIRDEDNELTPERKQQILDEVGDVLWYCAMLATELNSSLAEVAINNIRKLEDRNQRGVIQGSGDKR